MGGSADPQSSSYAPIQTGQRLPTQATDAFGQSLVSRLWPDSGFRGASASPYLPIVQPLMQSYASLESLMPQGNQALGPAEVQKAQAAPGQNGKGSSALGSIMRLVDPVGSYGMFQKQ